MVTCMYFSLQEQVGEYMADVYNVSDLILISRKRYGSCPRSNHGYIYYVCHMHAILYNVYRREHLTPEQIRRWEEISKKVEAGDIADELRNVSYVCQQHADESVVVCTDQLVDVVQQEIESYYLFH